MFLLILNLLKKFNYNINKDNAKYFIKDLYKIQQTEDLQVQKQIKQMFADIDDMKKEEQQDRLEQIRVSCLDR